MSRLSRATNLNQNDNGEDDQERAKNTKASKLMT